MNFTDSLRATQQRTGSLVCVGLDPDPVLIPDNVRSEPNPVLAFNKHIIEATHDVVCAYKLNLAFYEALGESCWRTLKETLRAIPSSIITIGDAKRGDIGNTARMYARSMFEDFGFTATTVNPYMGFDSVEPFLQDEARGAFILALTSNPGAKDFQYVKTNGKPMYEKVVRKVKQWNVKGNCGVVVGATRPGELKTIRGIAQSLPLLIPGVGAQGGDLRAAVRYGCNREGELAIINASRAVLYASRGSDFAAAARTAATTLRDAINAVREEYFNV